jgi:hypothetical protein
LRRTALCGRYGCGFGDGYDVQDLDRWIDSLKGGADDDTIIARLK